MYLFNGVLLLATLLAGGPWASAQPQAPTLQALTESLPPLNYEHEGKITGFASELLDLMAAEAGIPLQKQLLPWVRAYDRATKPGDTVLYSLVRTPERESLFRWVGPIGPRRILFYKWADRSDIQLKSLDDARAYRIGTTLESAATKNLIKQGFVPMPMDGAVSGLEQGVNDEQNMRKFIAKRFDLLVSLDWAAAYNAKNVGIDPADLVPALVLDDSLNYWYGLNLSVDPDVAKRLNAALQKLRNDGRYTQLRQKYLLKAAK
ncbi:MAG TPA: hypothetical protein DHV01_12250 [Rhodoferax sp.]|uniref:substrate-binding periplasmic protein n=1 Tax=Rhodoferax sp. TaxID=50421 RepID=UPI000ED91B0B|nr:transporter substrate-binding domain-containing protein [Rhodoferax sp.]HCX82353.1 hypothetical protein [Rhodoferax sp.]